MEWNQVNYPRDATHSLKQDHHRRGYVELAIGANHAVKGTDGKLRYLEVHPYSGTLEYVRREEKREITTRVIAWMNGGQFTFADEAAMRAQLGGDEIALRLSQTTITWCHVSDDPRHPDHADRLAKMDLIIKGRRATIKKLEAQISDPADAEAYDILRNRHEAASKALENELRDRGLLVESTIGLLSDAIWEGSLPAARQAPAMTPPA